MERTSRRQFLHRVALGAAALSVPEWLHVPGAFAEQLVLTPRMTEGPFYPDKLPLDTDNDLLIVGDHITPAVGTVTQLGGRLLDSRGNPIRNATIEIWQVDHNGIYLHSGDRHHGERDSNFQGYGRFETGSTGEYRFRTIKPVSYGGRAPHIHVGVRLKGRDMWTTQCLVKGDPMNEGDGVLRSVRDPKARSAVLVDFAPVKGSKIGELAARFDIVLGVTPEG
jgi:protocatechuate 3,4-dioxygenase beta subunit